MANSADKSRSLVQSLAVQTQVHLAGTVGRMLKQIRDLEKAAPLFVEAGLVRSVDRPNPLTLNVAGISTKAVTRRVAGGFLYAAAGVRVDLSVANNIVATRGEDSVCEIDDIDYEDQSKRFQLIAIRQAYELASRALKSGEPFDLIVCDCPLLLNRSMVAPEEGQRYEALRKTYQATVDSISAFWRENRERMFPWNRQGTLFAGLASERFGAIIQIAQQDMRTEEGRRHVLHLDELAAGPMQKLAGVQAAISRVGERRFINGILGSFTRTAGFRNEYPNASHGTARSRRRRRCWPALLRGSRHASAVSSDDWRRTRVGGVRPGRPHRALDGLDGCWRPRCLAHARTTRRSRAGVT